LQLKLEEIYSLEEDVYSGDEAYEIEELLGATKKFMSDMGIVLGKPEEAPNPVCLNAHPSAHTCTHRCIHAKSSIHTYINLYSLIHMRERNPQVCTT
jgi:hypothetical protein